MTDALDREEFTDASNLDLLHEKRSDMKNRNAIEFVLNDFSHRVLSGFDDENVDQVSPGTFG